MMMRLFILLFGAALVLPKAGAQTFGGTGTTTLSVAVAAEASVRIDTTTTNLTSSTTFGAFTGTTNFTYRIRTTAATGSGAITSRVTADFAAGGPLAASGDLAYLCTVAAPGTACAGSQTSSTGGETPVASFNADARSADAGTGANSVSWTLRNSPTFRTGGYTSTVTFTISTT